MTDDFIRELQDDWRVQSAEVERVRRRLQARRWAPHLALGLEIAASATGVLAGLWYVWMAMQTGSLLFALSAGVMLIALPPAVVASVLMRRDALRWEVETPESVLKTALRRAEATLKVVRGGRYGALILAGFVGLLWVLLGFGVVREVWFISFYTVVVAAVTFVSLLVSQRIARRARRERDVCLRLLSEYDVGGAAGDSAP